jgi:hypothetical protein
MLSSLNATTVLHDIGMGRPKSVSELRQSASPVAPSAF